jgi:hypothetical protein
MMSIAGSFCVWLNWGEGCKRDGLQGPQFSEASAVSPYTQHFL